MDIAGVTRADVAVALRADILAAHDFFARDHCRPNETGVMCQAPTQVVYRTYEKGRRKFNETFSSERAAMEAFTRELRAEAAGRPLVSNTRPR
jgi:hypothetical protein